MGGAFDVFEWFKGGNSLPTSFLNDAFENQGFMLHSPFQTWFGLGTI